MSAKIDLWLILSRHVSSLLERDDGRWPVSEYIIFFVMPVVGGWLFALDVPRLGDAFYGAVISCYSIFAALLLSVQMALFGIFQRRSNAAGGKGKVSEEMRLENRRTLIRELNANVSFLIALSVMGAMISVFFLTMKTWDALEVFLSTAIVLHFMVNLLVVIKRAYVLFDKEYEN